MKRLDLPVVIILLLTATALQVLLAPLPLPLKLPFLPGVVCYYALARPLEVSLTVALWAGLLIDAMGGLPPATSSLTLGVMVLLLSLWREVLPEGTPWVAGSLGALAAPLLALVQMAVVARTGGGWPLTWQTLRVVLALIPTGFVTAALAWSAGWHLELLAENVAPRKEVAQRGS